MKYTIRIDPATGKDYTVYTKFRNGKIVSYGESPIAKCIPDLKRLKELEELL